MATMLFGIIVLSLLAVQWVSPAEPSTPRTFGKGVTEFLRGAGLTVQVFGNKAALAEEPGLHVVIEGPVDAPRRVSVVFQPADSADQPRQQEKALHVLANVFPNWTGVQQVVLTNLPLVRSGIVQGISASSASGTLSVTMEPKSGWPLLTALP